jgi:hypothetical protein
MYLYITLCSRIQTGINRPDWDPSSFPLTGNRSSVPGVNSPDVKLITHLHFAPSLQVSEDITYLTLRPHVVELEQALGQCYLSEFI